MPGRRCRPYHRRCAADHAKTAGGLRVGDRVVAVDGRPVADAASARATAESVRAASVLRVERGSRKFDVDATTMPQAVAVARAPATTAVDVDGVIVLRVASFTDGVRDESAGAIRAVAAGRKSAPYVIDVRSNPGGFADEAAATFGLFAPAATPFATAVGPNGAVAAKYVTSGPPTELAVPAPTALAVLVDEDTRSAAELFAAAARAQGGTVVGQTTFGKRSAQSLVPLRAAPNYAVRLTTARTVDATGADVAVLKSFYPSDTRVQWRVPLSVIVVPGGSYRPGPFGWCKTAEGTDVAAWLSYKCVPCS